MNRQNLQQKQWYVIHDQNSVDYGEANEDGTNIKCETKNIKSNLCLYSDAYVFVTGDITTISGNANTDVTFKNCVPFKRCVTHINSEHLDITMPMYNLLNIVIIIQVHLEFYGNLK